MVMEAREDVPSDVAQIDKALERASGHLGEPGRVLKLVSFGGSEDYDGLKVKEFPSKQLTEDPFQSVTGYGRTLRIPPYSMEQLVLLSEAQPIHGAAIEQKVSDVQASGIKLVPKNEDDNDGTETGDQKMKTEILDYWESLGDDFTVHEIMQVVDSDFEKVGWGMFECARDDKGIVRTIYHVPGHSVRSHTSGRLFAQIRQGRMVWFKAWNEPGDFLATSGRPAPAGTDPRKLANELMVFRKPSTRSTWYGIPTYVSAIGHISLAVSARDYNVMFFENAREPRYVFVLTGMAADVEETLTTLELHLRQQHRDPHRNLLLPIAGDAKVTIERLTLQQNDMHFAKLIDMLDKKILVAHRVPGDRLGVVERGALGGNVTNIVNRIYKDGVVSRTQDVFEDRLNRFLLTEYARMKNTEAQKIPWKVDLEELDISDEQVDTSITINLVKENLITLNEGRQKLGRPPRADFGDMTMAEWMKEKGLSGGAAGPGGAAAGGGMMPHAGGGIMPIPSGGEMNKAFDPSMQEEILRRLEDLDDFSNMILDDFDERGMSLASANGTH